MTAIEIFILIWFLCFMIDLVILDKNKQHIEGILKVEEDVLLGVCITLPIINVVILLMMVYTLLFDR